MFKYLFEHIKSLQCYEIDQEVQPSAFNAGFTIDLCRAPLVCALWMCTDAEIVTIVNYLHLRDTQGIRFSRSLFFLCVTEA